MHRSNEFYLELFRVTTEVKTWDVPDGEAPGRATTGRRVPDIIAVDPENNKTYVIDLRIAWTISTLGGVDYQTGDLARAAEDAKMDHWRWQRENHPDMVHGDTEFVPFGIEISGSLGPQASELIALAMRWVHGFHDSDLYHWSAPSFRRYWFARFGLALMRGRTKVAMAAARRQWPAAMRHTGLGSYAP